MNKFKLTSPYKPAGDQSKAIDHLVKHIKKNEKFQTLVGVTGSGKTFTMANVISKINKPTLIISHNKTLAAQLYSEFKEFFPQNAVEYFVSYYDYYQPEAYLPHTDVYIEKDSSINDNIDRLRLSATSSLMSRKDVVIISSVSCIYGLGSPDEYGEFLLIVEKGKSIKRDDVLKKLVDMHYERNDYDFKRSTFRVKGDALWIYPAYLEYAYRIDIEFDEITGICEIDPVSGEIMEKVSKAAIYPAKHFVTTTERIEKAVGNIKKELAGQIEKFKKQGKLLEAQRLKQRTMYDIEMMSELGYCSGVENYSRHISNRAPGSRPWCLIDYFPEDFLTIIDESHVAIPQIKGMYHGDKARKSTLVDYGFRLPSALDNRPLEFEEFLNVIKKVIFVSATPAEYEKNVSADIVEQIIRPTGLVDPPISIRPTDGQIKDLINEIQQRSKKGERVLVTTLTKRLSEDLTSYLSEKGIRVRYLHSEIDALKRMEILKDLRLGKFDCLIGINLLREGLDLPEVSLVAVLDADKEGFLRSATSLIQVAGRAARNVNSTVIFYADNMTNSLKKTVDETDRRRKIQLEFNKKNGITPTTIKKAIKDGVESYKKAKDIVREVSGETQEEYDADNVISEMEEEMKSFARNLQFEKAILLRDKIKKIRKRFKE